IEIYSVDEGFMFFSDSFGDWTDFGRQIVRTVMRNTGIPISLGLSSTKTLAKVAARFAKKYPAYRGACVIDSDEKRRKALELTSINDIWGVGRRNAPKLRRQGITTALQLADLEEERVKELFNIVGHRMWKELNGESCISREIVPPQRKTITCSRSFQADIYDYEELRKAIADFTATVGRRIRSQHLVAEALEVFVATNRFHTSGPQYFNAVAQRLSDPTDDTVELVKAAMKALEGAYRPGYGYKKAGVTITRCIDRDAVTNNLFADTEERERRRRLMAAMDRINASPANRNALHLASIDSPLTRLTRREHESRLFTTLLSDIIEINLRE
ncbi:MAG: DUF4113 domain-containing protein, partial [Muribaculaceae bacterium]|nr:DUF4113 domain-containing protein [Muribaculaceae bacterium]